MNRNASNRPTPLTASDRIRMAPRARARRNANGGAYLVRWTVRALALAVGIVAAVELAAAAGVL